MTNQEMNERLMIKLKEAAEQTSIPAMQQSVKVMREFVCSLDNEAQRNAASIAVAGMEPLLMQMTIINMWGEIGRQGLATIKEVEQVKGGLACDW